MSKVRVLFADKMINSVGRSIATSLVSCWGQWIGRSFHGADRKCREPSMLRTFPPPRNQRNEQTKLLSLCDTAHLTVQGPCPPPAIRPSYLRCGFLSSLQTSLCFAQRLSVFIPRIIRSHSGSSRIQRLPTTSSARFLWFRRLSLSRKCGSRIGPKSNSATTAL
jgi:hypothetical protein